VAPLSFPEMIEDLVDGMAMRAHTAHACRRLGRFRWPDRRGPVLLGYREWLSVLLVDLAPLNIHTESVPVIP
jgi:hypothetical protein